jgi:xanthine dehydrogenase YagS FAD-binding subunit
MLSASGESRTVFGARFELSVDSGADADASPGGGTGAVSAEATSSESAFARLALVPRDSQDASNANTPTAERQRPKVTPRSRRDARRTQRKVRHVAFSAPRAQLHPDMPPFSYHRPETPDAALAALAADHAVALGGGTDLLLTLREQLVHAEHLVDLRRLPGARDISARDDGSVRLGGAVRIADLASHPVIRGRFAALAEAARSVGTPALRNMGTIAGNLCQRPRCWYFRGGVACLKTGATGCPAAEGESQYHAILDAGPCHAVHPSDPAVALVALEATVEIVAATGSRRSVPVADFHQGAASNPHGETVLAHGEMIDAVELPGRSAGGTQRYAKLMQRGAWDFALVSLAATKRADGEVRLVLGGVGPRPYRVNRSVEEDVASGALDDESVDALAERALYDARPLAKNRYKVRLAATLLKDAMRELSRA